MKLKEKIEKIGRDIGNVSLVAVTKARTVEEIKKAINSGAKIIGENRIQEAEQKYNELKQYLKENRVEFHFIGHLQTNKAKKAVGMFDMIQTIDSERLAKEIDKQAKNLKKMQKVLIQVNIGEEKQKSGVMPEEAIELIKKLEQYTNIEVKGLMCIPPYGKNPRPYFKNMKKLKEQTRLEILSMGMSSDYKMAVEEGSNMVRIGTMIFGERKY